MTDRQPRTRLAIALLAGLAIAVLLICPFIGMQKITPWNAFGTGAEASARQILLHIRIPRIAVAFLAGVALAVSGMTFQAIFRNPLATPFTLGTASGASLGAAFYVRLGIPFAILGISGVSIFAFAGALGAVALVYGLTCVRRGFSTATMLLAGVAVSLFFSSLILFMQYISDFTQSFRMLRWLMGGLGEADYNALFNLLPTVLVGVLVLFFNMHELNLLTTGDDIAASRGVAVVKVKRILFAATSLMVGAVVAFCGPIGFVGMMAPHICRLLVGPNHRRLLPATLLFGGAFLVLCDTLARTLIPPAEIPVGVITSLLGGPFFVWLLVRAPANCLDGR